MIIEDLPSMKSCLSRERYLQVVNAALLAGQFRFAREAVLNWLASYPGDLSAALFYAQALVGEHRISQALPVLEGLCMADPEFVKAVEALVQVMDLLPYGDLSRWPAGVSEPEPQLPLRFFQPGERMQTYWFALMGRCNDRCMLAPWGEQLWNARQATAQGDLKSAEQIMREVLNQDPDHPLVCTSHLQLLGRISEIPLEVKRKIACSYHQRWPNCLAGMLWLADWSMEDGDSHQAVALLHQAAARDVSGQVSRRLWGKKHPYRSLWPERLELALDIPVPAEVAAALGWNRLPPGPHQPLWGPDQGDGHAVEAPAPQQGAEQNFSSVGSGEASHSETRRSLENGQTGGLVEGRLSGYKLARSAGSVEESRATDPPGAWALEPEESSSGVSLFRANLQGEAGCAHPEGETSGEFETPTPTSETPPPPRVGDQELKSVSEELERLAEHFKLSGLTHLDGRYPVYVVLSVRSKLQAIYGFRAAAILESEMNLLVQAVRDRRGWGAMLFLADDPVRAKSQGIKATRYEDPWELKLALSDLDSALGKCGQRIGAVLIVGGPEVVPFHHLPNPVDDQDVDVPSDNPYATRNGNYFILEWPVGRLPGGAGEDVGLLVSALRRIRKHHIAAANTRRMPWYKRYSQWLHRCLEDWLQGGSQNFGYTAAVWQKIAALVFRPIGKAEKLYVSPPLGIYGLETSLLAEKVTWLRGMRVSKHKGVQGNRERGARASPGFIPSPVGQLGYFNLHGVVDAPEWFGQRDLDDLSEDSDYPVALRPQDISSPGSAWDEEVPIGRSPHKGPPQVVFTEACYGLHILGKKPEEAISLKFLEAGSLAVVGSTCMAYGSIDEPLTAADLLGHAFWTFLKQGMTVGEALRHAKIYLAGEMDHRQEYLDGEDQKTLISFVLYGDPLAKPAASGRVPKSIRYLDQPLGEIKTVCDRVITLGNPMPVPKEVLASVSKVVAQYLPGMSDAQLAFAQERELCNGNSHTCPTSQFSSISGESKQEKATRNLKACRRLVLLSKHVAGSEGMHPQYARLTLDEQGKLVKLVVSR